MERANVGLKFKYIRFILIHLNLHSLFIVLIDCLMFQVREQPVRTVSQTVKVKIKAITNPARDVMCM